MRTLGRRERAVCSLLLLAATAMALPAACGGARRKPADPWRVVRGGELWSPAWSPSGRRIAFVAQDDGDDLGTTRASIWLMTAPRQGKAVRLRRLAVLSRKQGIPTALFWMSNSRIGWASSHYSEYTPFYNFMHMSLAGGRPHLLVNRSFQGTTEERGGWCAPTDVYCDHSSLALLFSESLPPNDDAYVRVIPVATRRVRSIQVHYPGGLTYLKDGAYVSQVTLCGSLRNPRKPRFYLAAVFTGEDASGWRLWRSDSYSLRQDKVLLRPQHSVVDYPRTSPDGKVLAWLRTPEDGEHQEIDLSDLRSGKSRVLVTAQLMSLDCPYSWSPDGKEIAYKDGSRIKIVKVPSGISRTDAR